MGLCVLIMRNLILQLATKPGHTPLNLVGTSRSLSDKAVFPKLGPGGPQRMLVFGPTIIAISEFEQAVEFS